MKTVIGEMLHKKIKHWGTLGELKRKELIFWGLLRAGSDSSFMLIFCVFVASILSGSVLKYRES